LGNPRDAAELRRALAEYYAMISHMDEWIGKIHDAVEEIGATENTLIIHTADHGLAVGQHGLLGKQNLYQHSLHVPLIVAGPGFDAGHVSEELCYQHDLHPTLLNAAGLEDAGDFQILGNSPRKALGAAFRDTLRSLRNAQHKLIITTVQGSARSELFDLESDPWETRNLIGVPAFRPVAEHLEEEMRKFFENIPT
jgi:arylsulfatase A-like enzyme